MFATAYGNNLLDRETEKKTVYRLSRSAAHSVFAEINHKADQIYGQFDKIWPFNRSNRNATLIKQAIANGLYKQFGAKVVSEIPYTVKAQVEKSSVSVANHLKERGRPPTRQEAQYMSQQLAGSTQNLIRNNANNAWQKFQNEKRKEGQKMVNPENSLMKRESFLERIRNRFKFFQIDPVKQAWVVPVVTIVLVFVAFAFLPGLSIAVMFWQTVIMYGVIYPLVNKLFLGYYFYQGEASSQNIGPEQSMGAQQGGIDQSIIGAQQGGGF
jgi:hypothetical protein